MDKVRIYNPTTEDFTVNYNREPYTIKALEIRAFKPHIAAHVKKHLVDKIYNERGPDKNPVLDKKKIADEIDVSIDIKHS